MRNVYLTSFFRSHELPAVPHSCAVYPPKGYEHLPKVAWTDIRDDTGRWIRPRDFIMQPRPLQAYRDALYAQYLGRLDEARAWAQGLIWDVALCCWCPYDKAARRQLEQFGSFVCHTAVISEFVENELGLRVWEDGDRRRMAVLQQH